MAKRAYGVGSLWDLLTLMSAVAPLGGALGLAAESGLRGHVFAVIIGLSLGAGNVWMMCRVRHVLRSRSLRNWVLGTVYISAILWVVFGDLALAFGMMFLFVRWLN